MPALFNATARDIVFINRFVIPEVTRGNKIQAIRLLRDYAGYHSVARCEIGLRDAKDFVEDLVSQDSCDYTEEVYGKMQDKAKERVHLYEVENTLRLHGRYDLADQLNEFRRTY